MVIVHMQPRSPVVASLRLADPWIIARGWSWLLPFLCLVTLSQAQTVPGTNQRSLQLLVQSDTTRLDTLSIVPGSFSLFRDSTAIDPALYEVLPYQALLIRKGKLPADTLRATYRVMPLLLGGPYSHKDREKLLSSASGRVDPFKYVPPAQDQDLFATQGLNKTGSISRGVLFGNNQDLSVNSTLNLEISGRLTDNVNVLASVTDNNIPIQAGGNTLELQDFDQVFIKLYGDPDPRGNSWDLIAGDLVLQRPKSHFLTYLKKNKGLSFNTRFPVSDGVTNSLGTSAAISKGKFARNQIQGIEGVQGPYRLRGGEGENFIIVLSGSERVFIDGIQLQRGQENDYVIDYNTAEVSFTANRLITKDRRIVVEFQYSEKSYLRSMLTVNEEVELGTDTKVRFNLFTEQDHRNQTLQQSLTDDDKDVLTEAGDDPLNAAVPGADSVAYDPDQVQYRVTDSLGYDPVYVYSTDPLTAQYQITFSLVGSGLGDYVQQEFTPNGRVYRWVAPDTVNGTIVRNGDSAPIRLLIAPTSHQLLTLGAEHIFSERTKGQVELAYSNRDRNTFSSIDEADDQGYGIFADADHIIPLGGKDTTLQLIVGGETEAISKNFRFIERYRAVEFERNWNTLRLVPTGDQLLAAGTIGVRGKRIGSARYGLGTYQISDQYSGCKQELTTDLHPGKFDIVGTASQLRTTKAFNSTFLRHKGKLARRMEYFTLGILSEHELNRYRPDTSDALLVGSYQFHEWEAFIQSPDSFRTKWRLYTGGRFDEAVDQGALARTTKATTYGGNLVLGRDRRNRLATTVNYRRLEILDSSLTSQRPEDTYLTRLEYDLTAMKGVMLWNLFYEFGSGLEQRQEFVYIEVPAGQGIYVWIDYNDNGLKELNEFEIASFGYEANFVRVFVPSNEYVRTFSNQFSTSLDIRPAVIWGNEEGLKRFVGRFSDLASFRVDRKTGEGTDLVIALDPFSLDPLDTSLTAYSSSVRNTLFYDRTSRVWSVDHTFQNDQSKSLLLNGSESRTRRSDQIRVRWNTDRRWTVDLEGEQARIGNRSDFLEGRNYSLDNRSLRPRVTWQPNTSIRASMSFKYTDKQNDPELGNETALMQDLGAEFRFNAPGKGSIQVNANLVDIAYEGEVNSSLGNEMLQGLKPGTNVTWTIALQRTLSNHLQIDLTYNGRRSETTPAVHVGGAQVRAYF